MICQHGLALHLFVVGIKHSRLLALYVFKKKKKKKKEILYETFAIVQRVVLKRFEYVAFTCCQSAPVLCRNPSMQDTLGVCCVCVLCVVCVCACVKLCRLSGLPFVLQKDLLQKCTKLSY